MGFSKIVVLGLGKVGLLAAELLVEAGFDVTGTDFRPVSGPGFGTLQAGLNDSKGLVDLLRPYQAVLSCLPYALNLSRRQGRAWRVHPLLRSDGGCRHHPRHRRTRVETAKA